MSRSIISLYSGIGGLDRWPGATTPVSHGECPMTETTPPLPTDHPNQVTDRYTVVKLTDDPTDHRRLLRDTLAEENGPICATQEVAAALAALFNRQWRERLRTDARLIVLPVAGRRRLWLVPPVAASDGTDGGGEVA